MSACTGTVLLTAVVNWFRRKVGIATGILTSGFAMGGLMVPLVAFLIEIFGWQMAVGILGFGMWGVCLPLSLIVRHKPDKYGLLPDGETSDTFAIERGLTSPQSDEKEIVTKQALKSGVFWHIALALIYYSLVLNAAITHVMPYLSSVGIARSTSSLVASVLPLVSIVGRLSFGWLGDRFDRRRVAAVGFALMGTGLLFLGYVTIGWIWLLVPFLLLFGIGWGGNVTMRVALVRECFGTKRFGTMHGFIIGIMMIGNIAGPPLAGWVFDKWGSYQGIWLAFAGLAIGAIVMITTTPPVTDTTRVADNSTQ